MDAMAANDPSDKLVHLLHGRVVQSGTQCTHVILCPTSGGRVFAEVAHRLMRRADLDCSHLFPKWHLWRAGGTCHALR